MDQLHKSGGYKVSFFLHYCFNQATILILVTVCTMFVKKAQDMGLGRFENQITRYGPRLN